MTTSKTNASPTSKVKLSDIKITHLSTEALNLLSMTIVRIRKASGKHFSFSDPKLLEKISYKYKRINDPEITGLYKEFKQALKRSLSASFIMPNSSDPESPHRPALGLILPEQVQPTFFLR